MQRNNVVAGRPRSRTYPSIPSTSYSKHPINTKGGDDDVVDGSPTTRSIGYCDDSIVRLANQSEEQNLLGVMDRLQVAKSRAKVDRNQETMRLRKDCWILESQRKAMLNSTVAFSDLLRSTRLKNARAAVQAGGDHQKSSGIRTPDGTPPISPRLHTKLLRWRGITLATEQEPDESSDGSKTDTKNRLPGITQAAPSCGTRRQRPSTGTDTTESEICENGRGYGKVVGVKDTQITSGLTTTSTGRPRSRSFRSTPPSEHEQRRQSSREAVQAADSQLQAKMIMERALLQRRPKTAAPKLALTSEKGEEDKAESAVEETEILQDTSSAVGTPPSSRRRARSMSYMALAQNSVSASGKVRAVNEKTISLHGRTTRELRKMTHIDNVAAAESEERRKQIEERKREIKEKERQKLQEKVDNFLKKIDGMTKEELHEKRSLYSGLTVSF